MINTHGLDMTQRLYYFFPKRPIFACFHLTQLEMRMVICGSDVDGDGSRLPHQFSNEKGGAPAIYARA